MRRWTCCITVWLQKYGKCKKYKEKYICDFTGVLQSHFVALNYFKNSKQNLFP